MIHKLSGIHETVDFREDEQVCLYYNDEYENYPPHWHTSFEVLMPIVNGYKALCGGKEYNLREGDVLIIGPCMLHELLAELAYYDYNPGYFDYTGGVSADL